VITPPERSPERDDALEALLPNVPFDGWTYRALRVGLVSRGVAPEEAKLLFAGGASDMIEAFSDWADRRMTQAAAAETEGMKLADRVRALIMLRLRQNRPYREAVRRAVAVLSLPRNVRLAATCTARTVDAIWHAAGDRSTDFSWYTKRAILTPIYTATVLFWLRDTSEDDEATLAFLNRRLATVALVGTLRQRVEKAVRGQWRAS
jgi:ubiquinone biosynthesis protein COQ9